MAHIEVQGLPGGIEASAGIRRGESVELGRAL